VVRHLLDRSQTDTETKHAMKRLVPLIILLAGAVLPARAEEKKAAADRPDSPPAHAAPAAAAEPAPESAEKKDVQGLADDFDKKRRNLLEAHKAAVLRLRQARTEEERRRIVEELRQLQQQRLEQQRENIREMREQMRQTQRPNRPGG